MQSESALKKAFALAMMRPAAEPFKIAFALFPDQADTPRALIAASEWPNDPEVRGFQDQATNDPQAAGLLPSKHHAAQEVLARARNERDNEVFVKLMTLYCNIMGQIDKPAPAAAAPTIINNPRVIVMPAQQDKNAWTRSATEQQRQLVLEGERLLNAG